MQPAPRGRGTFTKSRSALPKSGQQQASASERSSFGYSTASTSSRVSTSYSSTRHSANGQGEVRRRQSLQRGSTPQQSTLPSRPQPPPLTFASPPIWGPNALPTPPSLGLPRANERRVRDHQNGNNLGPPGPYLEEDDAPQDGFQPVLGANGQPPAPMPAGPIPSPQAFGLHEPFDYYYPGYNCSWETFSAPRPVSPPRSELQYPGYLEAPAPRLSELLRALFPQWIYPETAQFAPSYSTEPNPQRYAPADIVTAQSYESGPRMQFEQEAQGNASVRGRSGRRRRKS